MRNAAMLGLQRGEATWIETTGGRNVCISALYVDVTRRVHRGAERRTGQPRRRRLRPAARVVRHSGGGVRPAGRAGRTIVGRNARDRRGVGGSAYRGAGRSLGR